MKTEILTIRVSRETKNLFKEKAIKCNTTLSKYVLAVLRNRPIKVQALPDVNALELKQELNAIGKNIWILLKYYKSLKLGQRIQLEELLREVKTILIKINYYYDSKDFNRD